MTHQEIKVLIQWAAANFPHIQQKEMGPTAELWYKMLADIPYDIAEKALIKVLATARFFPSIADIREAAVDIVQPLPSAAVAWEEVSSMQRVYSFRESGEGIKHLSPLTKRVVRAIGLWDLYNSPGESSQRMFFKLYEAMAHEQRKLAVLPDGIRQLINQRTALLLDGGDSNADTTS